MSGFGRRIDGPLGRRNAPRKEVTLLGSATSMDGSRSVCIEDLSPTGAKLCGRGLPRAGEEIMVRIDQLYLFGRVAWDYQDHRGIRLEVEHA